MALTGQRRILPSTSGGPYLLIAYLAGTATVFVGERVIGGEGAGRWAVSASGGVLSAIACALWGIAWWRSDGEARRTERLAALLSGAGLAALGLYFLNAELVAGTPLKGGQSATGMGLEQVLAALWPVLWLCAVVPLVFVQWSMGSMSGGRGIEGPRVRASAVSGAMTAAFFCTLFLLNAAVNRRDRHVDLSYFRTAAPSETTRELVMGMDADTEVLMFFPPKSEVLSEVRAYFSGMDGLSTHLSIRAIDSAAAPQLVRQHRVRKEGTVVIARGEARQRIPVGTELSIARRKLSRLDTKFQEAVLKLTAKRGTTYFIVGHGERSARRSSDDTRYPLKALKEYAERSNLTVKELGATDGLTSAVPDDAALLVWTDPRLPLFPGETEAVIDYLERGGRMLLTLDPDSNPELEKLMAFLGVSFDPVKLASERAYLPLTRTPADKYNLITNGFSTHPAVQSLGADRKHSLVLFPRVGALDRRPDAKHKVSFTVRSTSQTWSDKDGDFTRDEDESLAVHNLVAAITGRVKPVAATKPSAHGQAPVADESPDRSVSDEMRVIVVADTDLFSDKFLGVRIGMGGQPGNLKLLVDGMKWLVKEGSVSGVTQGEQDIKIAHTRDEDALWFYATVFGFPLLIILLGFATRFGRGWVRE